MSAAAAKQVPPVSPSTLQDEIRRRAYERYLERGNVPGAELDDWLQAERELLSQKTTTHEKTGE